MLPQHIITWIKEHSEEIVSGKDILEIIRESNLSTTSIAEIIDACQRAKIVLPSAYYESQLAVFFDEFTKHINSDISGQDINIPVSVIERSRPWPELICNFYIHVQSNLLPTLPFIDKTFWFDKNSLLRGAYSDNDVLIDVFGEGVAYYCDFLRIMENPKLYARQICVKNKRNLLDNIDRVKRKLRDKIESHNKAKNNVEKVVEEVKKRCPHKIRIKVDLAKNAVDIYDVDVYIVDIKRRFRTQVSWYNIPVEKEINDILSTIELKVQDT